MAHRLEPSTESGHRLAHPLGHGADLAVLGGQQDDDAVGFAELVGAQHDRGVAVEVADAHESESSRPNLRLRLWNVAIAVCRSFADSSVGRSRSTNTSSP